MNLAWWPMFAAIAAGDVLAQSYPAKPIRFIVGPGPDALARVIGQKLTDAWPDHMAADQFAATADQLRAAGQGGAAIQALDLGLKRFPQDPALRGQIEQAKAAPAPGSDELKMLESLGYLGAKK